MVVENSPTKSMSKSEEGSDPKIFFFKKEATQTFSHENGAVVIKDKSNMIKV